MSRSVKDLRELICVSRLTYHSSSDDSDSLVTDDSSLDNKWESFTLDDKINSKINISPDSGCAITTSVESNVDRPSSVSTDTNATCDQAGATNHRKAKRHKKRKKKLSNYSEPHEIPKGTPLPPVNQPPRAIANIGTDERVNFSHLLTQIDTTVIASWLTRSNDLVTDLCAFCNRDQNYVRFAQFWVTEFPDLKKQEIYELEFNILVDELSVAFSAALSSCSISQSDLMHLLRALFKEYPGELLTSRGNYLFLNYLDVLSSNRTVEYKNLLSDVRCSTNNRQHVQWLLAIRAFSLVNVWSAVIKFYVKLSRCPTPQSTVPASNDKDSVHIQRMIQAIRLGYLSVIPYLLKSGCVDAHSVDSHGKSWVFHAVICDQMSVLVYLLTKTTPNVAINAVSDSGNTALHAAANTGNVKATRLLLQNADIDVDVRNPQCDATPLHLAIMHGHKDVAKALLSAGADATMTMGGMSVGDIADAFTTREMIDWIQNYTQS